MASIYFFLGDIFPEYSKISTALLVGSIILLSYYSKTNSTSILLPGLFSPANLKSPSTSASPS